MTDSRSFARVSLPDPMTIEMQILLADGPPVFRAGPLNVDVEGISTRRISRL